MTVPATARRAGPYNGNGATTSFSFSFKTYAAGDLLVTKTGTNGLESTLLLNSDYSVTLNGDQDASPGGSITYPISGTALASGEKLTVLSDLDYEQTTDLLGGGAFNARVIEDTFDRTVIQIQQLEERADRTLTLPVSAAADTTLPVPEANKVIAWNETGDGLVNLDASDLASVVVTGTSYTDIFNGTGAQTAFVLTANPGSVNALDIAISGVSQVNGVDFTVSGTTLTFTSAPPAATGNVVVRYVAALPVGTANAQDVTFNPAGTGAVTRTAQDKMRDVVSVKDFGAVGDGVTDDTAAIQAALNTGKAVDLGDFNNVYLITSTISYTGKVVIYGNGATIKTNVQWLKVTNGTGSLLKGFQVLPVTTPYTIKRDSSTWVNVAGDVVQSLEGYIPSGLDADIFASIPAGHKAVNATIKPSIYFTVSSAAGGKDVEITKITGYQLCVIVEGYTNINVHDNDFGGGDSAYAAIVVINGVPVSYASVPLGFTLSRGVNNSVCDNKIKYATLCGITWFGNDEFECSGNTCSYNGESGIKTYQYDGVAGPSATIGCVSTLGRIYGNKVSDHYYDGIDAQVIYGVPFTYVYSGTEVVANTMVRNRHTGSIANGASMLYSANHANLNGTHGISLTGSNNTAIGNHCRNNCTTGTTVIAQPFDLILQGDDCVGAFNNISNSSAPSTYNYLHTGLLGANPTSSREGVDFGNYCDQGASRIAVSPTIPSTKIALFPYLKTTGYLQTSAVTNVSGSTYTVTDFDSAISIYYPSGSTTITLPAASSYPGRVLKIRQTTANTVVSASSNISLVDGTGPTTAILAATAGKWCELQSSGSFWFVMSAN